jgi:enamine deaminase RidA (YjgF/YER057c/UK114 family)
MTVADLVKVTTFLTRQDQADTNGRIRREFLGGHRPALTVVVVETLESQWLLEIEAVAAK